MSEKDRAYVQQQRVTTIHVASIKTEREPDVSVILEFAKNLQRFVDQGMLDKTDKVSGGKSPFELTVHKVVRENYVGDEEVKKTSPAEGTLRPMTRSEAAKIAFPDTEAAEGLSKPPGGHE